MSLFNRAIDKFLRLFPSVKRLIAEVEHLHELCGFPPGHYYSCIVNAEEYYAQQKTREASDTYLPIEIDFRENDQIELLKLFQNYYNELPFGDSVKDGLRYYYNNEFFTYADAVTMFSMLRHFKPKKIVEIGAGFSSALILDTNERFLSNETSITFIEPNPERLESILKPGENVNIQKKKVQDVDISFFETLESGDFLLIDTSHVSKSGSDVNYIYFNILPYLKKGVKIHIHDIFFPMEYPEKWVVKEWRGWNEIFLLRAFLAFNADFSVLFFNSFLQKRHKEYLSEKMPLFLKQGTTVSGGIWIERV
ncbi:class I SAM-dependent methyltransferase [Ferruginibacter lapsinanis]|uniref:class I SAM-dependent methyltransferase n=1 Tax=Ferruginibacter lapsinanis TaxID=563172 RepID=UPI001E30EAED|nr:class I SAM-dependent methyltransferase [Ferruginibacter lapsinanis]UEG49462.1 class I SAM-dependent methyltransferase [Ferruginibacter lapsinanis]